jgi:hypothetical protein
VLERSRSQIVTDPIDLEEVEEDIAKVAAVMRHQIKLQGE